MNKEKLQELKDHIGQELCEIKLFKTSDIVCLGEEDAELVLELIERLENEK